MIRGGRIRCGPVAFARYAMRRVDRSSHRGAAEAQREPGWEVRVAERVELVAGAAGTMPIAIAVDRGLHGLQGRAR